MLSNVNDLALLFPEQTILEFSHQERDEIWLATGRQSNRTAAGRWTAYLNRLTGKVFSRYITEEPDLPDRVVLWPESEGSDLGHLVPGVAIDLGATRLVLVPSDEEDTEELRVPREWVELPDWAGHYYLSVRLDLENCWLQVLGFATHQQLCDLGRRDRLDETYVLDLEDTTADLTALWVGQERSTPAKPVVSPAISLSPAEAASILERVAPASLLSPRLEIPFSQWGGLLADRCWRQALSPREDGATTATLTNLKTWLREELSAGWQALDTLLSPQSASLAHSFRQGPSAARGVKVEGVKLLDLGVDLGQQSIALLVSACEIPDDRVEIRVQLLPAGELASLPPNIQLALLSPAGQVLQEVRGRGDDRFIQLKRFTCATGKGFGIRVGLEGVEWSEAFVIQ